MKFCKLFLVTLFLIFLFNKCAKIGSPTGGQSDKIPPKIIKSIPENGAVNFKGNKIYITFDEFVQINKLNENLIVSPPLKNNIKTTIRHKTLILDLNNELEDSVTYCLNFGSSIVDFHESNPLENFEYVFSTGPNIDSFSITGKVLKAFNLEPPDKNTFVLVYKNLSDTAPLKTQPLYIGRCDKEGNYQINYLKEGRYRIYALTDKNNNFKFDLNDEYFAFYDSIVEINAKNFVESKVYILDSSLISTFKVDSLVEHKIFNKRYTASINLKLFLEEQKNQFIISKNRPDSNRFLIFFNRSLFDNNFEIFPLNFKPSVEKWFLKEISANKDTFMVWLIDSILYSQDTLICTVKYSVLDTLENLTNKIDTINFILFGRRGLTEKKTQEDKKIKLYTSLQGRNIKELSEDLYLISPYPIYCLNSDLIKIQKIKDTINNEDIKFLAEVDSLNFRKIKIKADFKPGSKYNIIVLPLAVKTFYQQINDTLNFQFECRKEDYYGKLVINIDKKYTNLIIQLLSMKGEILNEKRVDNENTIVFNYLQPGQYKLRTIIDNNNNGKWDTGNFKKKIQPEEVIYYKGNIEIRSNWEVNLNWQIFD